VSIWDLETGVPVFEKRVPLRKNDVVESYRVGSAALTPDGTKLVWAVSRPQQPADSWNFKTELTSWDIASGKRLMQTEFEADWGCINRPFGDNRSVLTADSQGKLAVWDLVSGKFTRTFDMKLREEPVISPDGKSFVVFEEKRFTADYERLPSRYALFDAATGKATRELLIKPELRPATGSSFAFSPDGKLLVTAQYDSTALVWDIAALSPAK
jgi:WD40 repeat protein